MTGPSELGDLRARAVLRRHGTRFEQFQLGQVFMAQNKEVLFCDQLAKGYIRLTLTKSEAVADFIEAPPLKKPFEARVLARFRVRPTGEAGAGPIEKI